jgi:hypothetical protein
MERAYRFCGRPLRKFRLTLHGANRDAGAAYDIDTGYREGRHVTFNVPAGRAPPSSEKNATAHFIFATRKQRANGARTRARAAPPECAAFDFCNGSPQKWNGGSGACPPRGMPRVAPMGRTGQGRSAKTAPVVMQISYAQSLWIT